MGFITIDAQATNKALIAANGSYRIFLGKPANSFSVLWSADDVVPAGILRFSVDGDPGERPEPIFLEGTGGTLSRTKVMNMLVWFIDVEVSYLPSGGHFTLMCAG